MIFGGFLWSALPVWQRSPFSFVALSGWPSSLVPDVTCAQDTSIQKREREREEERERERERKREREKEKEREREREREKERERE